MGQRCFSFRMGSFYVLAHEWTSDQYLAWARADYDAAWSDPTIAYTLVGSHYYDGLNSWVSVPSAQKPCGLFLAGHSHRTRTLQSSPFPVHTVATAQDHYRSAFFEFQRTAEGWRCPQETAHADGVNVHRLFGDWGANPAVSVTYHAPNDGTGTTNTASITNALPHDFDSPR